MIGLSPLAEATHQPWLASDEPDGDQNKNVCLSYITEKDPRSNNTMILHLILHPQELAFPEVAPDTLMIAIRRREIMTLPFRQLHAVVRGWQELIKEGQRRGYRCLESQEDGRMATLFFCRSQDDVIRPENPALGLGVVLDLDQSSAGLNPMPTSARGSYREVFLSGGNVRC